MEDLQPKDEYVTHLQETIALLWARIKEVERQFYATINQQKGTETDSTEHVISFESSYHAANDERTKKTTGGCVTGIAASVLS